ncbi:hypothetical protein PENPOL_c015G01539 [Penicillium polonicum]|uniref:Major facilitator superfamily (MFS) profile domain-containing protein n=1 Tax=Penicillium polonicum TaxID=60169 RepID=A0A1V6NAX3_PENPO|nr:hypothetical protein PENPOL_c015G01539 [Penicillium polonicum]
MFIISSAINLFVSLGSMCALDTVGRWFMLIMGSIIQVSALMTMGGLGTVPSPSYEARSATVAMIVLFGAGFTFGWAPIVHTLSTELPSARLRDTTYRCGSLVHVATNFVISFTLPYLLNAGYANLQSKVGFIYSSIAFFSILFPYFCVPDCRGRSLEYINRLFEANVPARKFQSVKIEPFVQIEEAGESTTSDSTQT